MWRWLNLAKQLTGTLHADRCQRRAPFMLTDVSGGYLSTFRTTQTRARASKRLTSLNSNGPPSTSASGYCNHWHNVRKQSNFTRSAAYVTYREIFKVTGPEELITYVLVMVICSFTPPLPPCPTTLKTI